jgi:hypothetical protein
LTKTNSLIYIAGLYNCMPIISNTVELLVIRWSWSQSGNGIITRCVDILLLANKIRSKILYNDAFVHLVGLLGVPRYWEVKNRPPQDIRDHVVERLDDIVTLSQEDDEDKKPKNEAAFYRSIVSIQGASDTLRGLQDEVLPLIKNELRLDSDKIRSFGHLTCFFE